MHWMSVKKCIIKWSSSSFLTYFSTFTKLYVSKNTTYSLYSFDYLDILDDNGTFLGVFCGERHGTEIIVTGDHTQLIFHSDEIENRRGFNISFTAFQNFGEYYEYKMSLYSFAAN